MLNYVLDYAQWTITTRNLEMNNSYSDGWCSINNSALDCIGLKLRTTQRTGFPFPLQSPSLARNFLFPPTANYCWRLKDPLECCLIWFEKDAPTEGVGVNQGPLSFCRKCLLLILRLSSFHIISFIGFYSLGSSFSRLWLSWESSGVEN